MNGAFLSRREALQAAAGLAALAEPKPGKLTAAATVR